MEQSGSFECGVGAYLKFGRRKILVSFYLWPWQLRWETCWDNATLRRVVFRDVGPFSFRMIVG